MTSDSTAVPLTAGFVFISGPLANKRAHKADDRGRQMRRRTIGAGEAP